MWMGLSTYLCPCSVCPPSTTSNTSQLGSAAPCQDQVRKDGVQVFVPTRRPRQSTHSSSAGRDHAPLHTHTHTLYTHTYTHTHTLYTRTHTHTHTHTLYTHTHSIHAHTHTHTHTHTLYRHTHSTNTHTYTYSIYAVCSVYAVCMQCVHTHTVYLCVCERGTQQEDQVSLHIFPSL